MFDNNYLSNNVESVYINAKYTFGVVMFIKIGSMHNLFMKQMTNAKEEC